MLILSVIGILLNLAGISCTGVALRRTWQQGKAEEGGSARMFPWFYSTRSGAWLWVLRRLGIRRGLAQTLHPSGIDASAGGAVGASVLTRGPPPTSEDDPLDMQIKALAHRVDLVEHSVADERTERGQEVRHLRRETRRRFEALEAENVELRKLARRLTLGTVRLQMIGVLLLGAGTIVGSIPVLCGG